MCNSENPHDKTLRSALYLFTCKMKKQWRGSKDGVSYTAKLDGIKFSYSGNTGNKETSGSGSLLPRHFFKPRWQKMFREVFDEKDFNDICESLKSEYKLFEKNPEKYKRKPYRA